MELTVKRFDELTVSELYEALKLRTDVFVVEQNCVYPELDGLDQDAIHMFLTDEDGIEAYLRIMTKEDGIYFGRVVSKKRRCGLASFLLEKAIELVRKDFKTDAVFLEAQTYARSLYEKQGFRQISEEFLEDGIPHIRMKLAL